jgi:hypothetical protein
MQGVRIADVPRERRAIAPPSRLPSCEALRAGAAGQPNAKTLPRVLIVVNFHWTRQATAATTRMLMESLFVHYYNTPFDVVFVGPGAGAPGVLGNGLPENGFLSYHSLTSAYERYPKYEGYLFVNDDTVLVQQRFEPEMFAWRWTRPVFAGVGFRVCRSPPFMNWGWEAYCDRLVRAFNDLCAASYSTDCGGEHAFYAGDSDVFYVPGHLMPEYVRWERAMVKHEVFLEMAVPTILEGIADARCDTFENVDLVPTDLSVPVCTAWDHHRGVIAEFMVDSRHKHQDTCVQFHPVKVASSPDVRERVRKFLETQASKRCRRKKCKVDYAEPTDGFLWSAS